MERLLVSFFASLLIMARVSPGETKVYLWDHRRSRHAGDEVREDDCLTQLAVPRGCGPGGAKCVVTLSWEVVSEGKEMEFGITADLIVAKGVTSSGSWAAVGFSPDGKMARSDALECLFDAASGNVSVLDGWNTKDSENTVDPNQSDIAFISGSLGGGIGRCQFKRAIATKDPHHSYNLNHSWHILFAIGQLKGEVEEGVSPLLHHSWKWSGGESVNLLSPCVSPSAADEQLWRTILIRVHGSLMLFVFLLVLPTGALLARYFKEIVGAKWIKIHMTIMTLAVMAMILAFGFALGHTSLEFHVGVHQIVGIIVLPLAPLQVVIGFLRPAPEPFTTRRKIFNWIHRCLGVGILSAGFLLCYLGVGLLEDNDSGIKPWMYTCVTVCVVDHLLVPCVMEYLLWKSADAREYQKVSWKAEDDSSEEDSGVDIGRQDVISTVQHMKTLNKWVIAMLFLALGQGFVMASITSGLLFYHL